MGSSPSTAAAEEAPSPVVATCDNPQRMVVGGHVHLVVVTNRADEASKWVRLLPAEIEGKTRIVGVSLCIYEEHRHDGFVARRVVSIHISFLSRVLVYHLNSAEDGLYSPDVLGLLRQPCNLFAGEDVEEGLFLLGLPYRFSTPRTMDLVRVAEIYDAGHLVPRAKQCGMPLHVMLAMGVLGIAEGALRSDAGGATWAAWPLTTEQVEFAVQSAVVSQSLGLRAYLRENLPPLV